jgi:hypothetical protein
MFDVTSFEVMVISSMTIRPPLTRDHVAPLRAIARPDLADG